MDVTVMCTTPDCPNEGVALTVPPVALVQCGPCGAILAGTPAEPDETDETAD